MGPVGGQGRRSTALDASTGGGRPPGVSSSSISPCTKLHCTVVAAAEKLADAIRRGDAVNRGLFSLDPTNTTL